MFECLKKERVAQLFKGHVEGQSDNHKILYSLVAFEEWLREVSAKASKLDNAFGASL
jgi:hypothetical protein